MAKNMASGVMARFGLALACLLPVSGLSAPASASTPILMNGDFVGARDLAGVLRPVPFNFGVHTYFGPDSNGKTFAWSNTGSGALSWVANNGSQVIVQSSGVRGFAPPNPANYTGNVYVADASPQYAPGTYLLQTLNGLTVGNDYRVSFLQAAGNYYNQVPGSGIADTAQWLVGFGGEIVCPPTPTGCMASLTGVDANSLKESPLAVIKGTTGISDWERVTLIFKATKVSELLSFYASGSGAPPFALLADVSVAAVPEPSTWMMMILGLGVVGYSMRRRQGTPMASQRALG